MAQEKQKRHLFERHVWREFFHGISGNDETACLAIDVAQPGGCNDNILESARHDPILRLAHYIVNIDCKINI